MIFQYDARLTARLDEDISLLESQLGQGNAASFEEYKFKAGILRGLRMAREHVEELSSAIKDM